MNIFNVIKEIEKVDPEIMNRLDSRRDVFKHFAGFGKKLAVAAVPIAFGATLNKAYGKTNATVMEVLQYALKLENLEAEFYKQAVTAANTMSAASTAARGALATIRDHEVAHVAFLRAAISGAGGTPVNYTAANFDYTAKGNVPDVFTNYGSLLAVAQAFEDTGVRAYKGAAPDLVSNSAVLQAALQIHSVEARHAAHVRRMRRDAATGGVASNKPWITKKERGGLPSFAQPIYDGEELTNQAGVDIAAISSGGITINANAASEAFDEPLTMAQVVTIITPFLV